jgi:hypothetical protein
MCHIQIKILHHPKEKAYNPHKSGPSEPSQPPAPPNQGQVTANDKTADSNSKGGTAMSYEILKNLNPDSAAKQRTMHMWY